MRATLISGKGIGNGWFALEGDEQGSCATEGCGGQPGYRLEAGGVGSNYCYRCYAKLTAPAKTLEETTVPRLLYYHEVDYVRRLERKVAGNAELLREAKAHVGLLKGYVECSSEADWLDMRLHCERQLKELSAVLDKLGDAL
jgi:hypothetical protein